MSEKSGIEMIEDIMNRVALLERRFTNIEQMMKELLNRANGYESCGAPSLSAVAEQPRPSIGSSQQLPQKIGDEPTGESAVTLDASNIAKKEIQIGDDPYASSNPNTKTRVLGKIKGEDGRFISGVNVKVRSSSNKVIKETKTNRAGDWMCFLPPGQYDAEYYLKDIIHTKVKFNVEPGQTVHRVAQPQA